jgi:hypothetical protein
MYHDYAPNMCNNEFEHIFIKFKVV